MQLKGLVYTFWRWLEIVSIRFWIPWEQMFFISHPPSPTTFTRLAYSWICVCGFVFTWINANMRSSQYTKQYFVLSHLRLFSYDFAIHKKPLPSTSAKNHYLPHACKSLMQCLRRGNSGSGLWNCWQSSENVLRITKGKVTGQNMPSLQTYNKASDFVCSLIFSQERQY